MAERNLQNDLLLKRWKFRASIAVRDVMIENPDFTRKNLVTRSKAIVEKDHSNQLINLHRLEKAGQICETLFLMWPSYGATLYNI